MVLGMGIISRPAEASGLIGSTLEWQYYAGGSTLANNAGSNTSGSFVDTGSGVGGTFIEPLTGSPDLTIFNIDATGTTITFDYSPVPAPDSWSNSLLSLAPTIYNGIAINLYSAGTFLSVTIDQAGTNMVSFGPGDLSFTGNQIQVNWANLDFNSSTMVTLDVTLGPPSVPEPRTILLFLTSGVFLFWKLARSPEPRA